MSVATTRMSSKGQVVIPEEVRDTLHLKEGVQFIVVGRDDTVVLKVISEPSPEQFEDLLMDARAKAKKAKLKPSDVKAAVKQVRRKR
jgi:AbrB family looped-hinge helix DNA binding protein